MTATIFKTTFVMKDGSTYVNWRLRIANPCEYGVEVILNDYMAEPFIEDFLKHWTGEVERHESTIERDY